MKTFITLRKLFREIAILQSLAGDRLRAALPTNLTEQQFNLLSHLINTENGPETPAQLAHVFQVSRPAMTQLLQRMQRRHQVTLNPTAADGRARLVEITKEGRTAYERVFSALEADFKRLAQPFMGGELDALVAALGTLRRVIESDQEAETARYEP